MNHIPDKMAGWQQIHGKYLAKKRECSNGIVKDVGHLLLTSLRMNSMSKPTYTSLSSDLRLLDMCYKDGDGVHQLRKLSDIVDVVAYCFQTITDKDGCNGHDRAACSTN